MYNLFFSLTVLFTRINLDFQLRGVSPSGWGRRSYGFQQLATKQEAKPKHNDWELLQRRWNSQQLLSRQSFLHRKSLVPFSSPVQKTVTSYFLLTCQAIIQNNKFSSTNHGRFLQRLMIESLKIHPWTPSAGIFPIHSHEEQNLPLTSRSPPIPACHMDGWYHLHGSDEVDGGWTPPQWILLPWIREQEICEDLLIRQIHVDQTRK